MTNHRWKTTHTKTDGPRLMRQLRCLRCGASKYVVMDGDHVMNMDSTEPCDVVFVRGVMAE